MNDAPQPTGSKGSDNTKLVVLAAAAMVVIVVASVATLRPGSRGAKPNPESVVEGGSGTISTAPTQTIEQALSSVQVYVSEKNYGAARAILTKAIERYPSDPELRSALGDLEMLAGNTSAAYDQYVSAIESSENPGADLFFTAGTIASTLGEKERAVAHYLEAQRRDPGNPDVPLYLANVQLSMGKVEDAKKNIALAAKATPDRAIVWGTWAQIALRENKLEIALQQIGKARAIEPASVGWIVTEAKIVKRMGDPERAIEVLTTLSDETIADNRDATMTLAESYAMIGRGADASERAIAFARARPDDAQGAMDAAIWLERAGDREQALLWARRARDLGHERAVAWIDSLED